MLLTTRVGSPLSNTSSSQHACSCKSLSISLSLIVLLLIIRMSGSCNSKRVNGLRARLHQCLPYLAQHIARIINIVDQQEGASSNPFRRTHNKGCFDVLFLLYPV